MAPWREEARRRVRGYHLMQPGIGCECSPGRAVRGECVVGAKGSAGGGGGSMRLPTLPPGKVCRSDAASVSPASGSRETDSTKSALALPTTTSGGRAPPPACACTKRQRWRPFVSRRRPASAIARRWVDPPHAIAGRRRGGTTRAAAIVPVVRCR